MGIYSSGRRRLMLALLLTSVLLLALDAQGNTVLDRGRDGFQYGLDPLQSGADVVTRPVRNAWRGMTQYDDLERENQELREQIEGQRADQIMARAAIHEFDDLLALNNMDSLGAHPTLSARVLGKSPVNLREEVEIDRGTDDGVRVGMAVVAPGGLVGKVTREGRRRSWVQLITDRDYGVEVKVISEIRPEDQLQQNRPPNDAVPSEVVVPTTTSPPPSSVPPGSEPPTAGDEDVPPSTDETGDTAPPTTGDVEEGAEDGDEDGDAPVIAGRDAIESADGADTTSSVGLLQGQGGDDEPYVRLADESTAGGARFRRGDQVLTYGGDESLAPPDLVIGMVSRVERDSSSAGPRLYVELSADTTNPSYVQVVLYQPQSEVDPENVEGEIDAGDPGNEDGDPTEDAD